MLPARSGPAAHAARQRRVARRARRSLRAEPCGPAAERPLLYGAEDGDLGLGTGRRREAGGSVGRCDARTGAPRSGALGPIARADGRASAHRALGRGLGRLKPASVGCSLRSASGRDVACAQPPGSIKPGRAIDGRAAFSMSRLQHLRRQPTPPPTPMWPNGRCATSSGGSRPPGTQRPWNAASPCGPTRWSTSGLVPRQRDVASVPSGCAGLDPHRAATTARCGAEARLRVRGSHRGAALARRAATRALLATSR
jgi:hypothetical protein